MKLSEARKRATPGPLHVEKAEKPWPGYFIYHGGAPIAGTADQGKDQEATAALLAHCYNLVMVHGIVDVLKAVEKHGLIDDPELWHWVVKADEAAEEVEI